MSERSRPDYRELDKILREESIEELEWSDTYMRSERFPPGSSVGFALIIGAIFVCISVGVMIFG